MAHDPTALPDFVSACETATRVRDLWALALDFFHARGIDKISYHRNDPDRPLDGPPPIVSDGYPPGWVCKYIDGKLALIDPVRRAAARMSEPFLWSEIRSILPMTPEAERYLDIVAEADLGDGVAIQVYGPNLRNAYVGLGFADAGTRPTRTEMFELQCAAQIAHLRYCAIVADRNPAGVRTLSAREREVLEWMARGKSNGVIADILGLSRHTVDTLVRRIYDKLDVSDRVTAVLHGIGAGLLRTD